MRISLGSFSFAPADIVTMVGVLVMTAGLRMVWHRHRDRWDVEEAHKDGKLTEQEARRKIAWIKWRPVGVIGVGLALVIAAIATLGN